MLFRISSDGPSRLFDCEAQVLKERETYLRETGNVVPSYYMVSHVWGNIKAFVSLPGVPWRVPISDSAKLEAVLEFCKRGHIKWLWFDILCLDQADEIKEIDEEKGAEVFAMSSYYHRAAACLVVPENFSTFSTTYKQLMELLADIIDTDSSVQDNATRVWESIGLVDAIMADQWFWRIWTFQELMMAKKLILLDGQELEISRLRLVLDWYHKILRNGTLSKPDGGKEYDFVHPLDETVITKNWRPEKLGWDLKPTFEKDGHIDLITLVTQTRDKQCRFQVDKLLGLYGLLSDDEKVPIQATTIPTSTPTSALETMWKRTMRKIISSGKVWPLLHDLMNMNPNEAVEGERWMPEITALHRRGDAINAHPETLNHHNGGRIAVTSAGLEISVRVVGRVVGSSASLGDGGGENNKMLACIWFLKAKGFDTNPIVQHLKDGLAGSDGVLPGKTEESQQALEEALSALTLAECFGVVERTKLRRKLAYAPGVAGWDRTLLLVQIEGLKTPTVNLAWTHRSIPPKREDCWVLDVSSDSPSSVQRWIVANHVGSGKFMKIGTMRSHPIEVGSTDLHSVDAILV